jgi:hypothetical protein
MLRYLIGGMLIVHGLIVAAQSNGAFGGGGPSSNPSWLKWWPTALGQSWLLVGLGLEQTVAAWFAGVLWLIAGVTLLVAGLGVFGVLVPQGWWIGGAAMSLLMLLFYLHPFYGIGTGLSAAILVALLWAHWPALEQVGV